MLQGQVKEEQGIVGATCEQFRPRGNTGEDITDMARPGGRSLVFFSEAELTR